MRNIKTEFEIYLYGKKNVFRFKPESECDFEKIEKILNIMIKKPLEICYQYFKKNGKSITKSELSKELQEIKKDYILENFFKYKEDGTCFPINKNIEEFIWKTADSFSLPNILQYDNERIFGIYKITNKTNKKVYIGSSIDIYSRWKRHWSEAKTYNDTLGTVGNNGLHKDMKETSICNFQFEVIKHLETNISKSELLLEEKKQIEEAIKSGIELYNNNVPTKVKNVDEALLRELEKAKKEIKKLEDKNKVLQNDFNRLLSKINFLEIKNKSLQDCIEYLTRKSVS